MKHLDILQIVSIGLVVAVSVAVFLVCIATGHQFGIFVGIAVAVGYPILAARFLNPIGRASC